MRFFVPAFVLLALLHSSVREVSGTPEKELKVYQVTIEEYRAVLNEISANISSTTDAVECTKNGAYLGTQLTRSASTGELVKVHRFCCLVEKCPLYVRKEKGKEILTIKGMRFFGDFPVDEDLQSLGALGKKEDGFCLNLQGYYESDAIGKCLFRVGTNGVYSGSFTSFTPTGTEGDGTLNAIYGCRQRLSADDYVLSCFCGSNDPNCSYSTGYHKRVATFHDRFMLEGRRQAKSTIEFFHRNDRGERKVHCAYGDLAETPKGAVRAYKRSNSYAERLSIFAGVYNRNISRRDVPGPQSTCGLKLTFDPINIENEESVYNLTINMGAFEECRRNTETRENSWVHLAPTCPIDVSPNDSVSFVQCCRDSDACNHISNNYDYANLLKMSGNRLKFGFHFPWANACGDTLGPYYDLFNKYQAFCSYFYDIQKRRLVKLFDFRELTSSGTVMEIDGNSFRCKRATAIITRHKGCSEKFNYYDALDSPMRDIVACHQVVQYEIGKSIPRIPEERLIELFDNAMKVLDFRCMDFVMPLDMYFARGEMMLMTESSNYSACYLRLDAIQGSSSYVLSAGVVSEKDDTVFDFYSEHFVSQMLTEGVAFAYNSTEESAILICAGSSRCNEEEGFVERLLSLYHVNTIDTDFVAEVECGAKKCTDFSGCYRSRQHGEGVDSEDEEGCIADISSEQIHLFVCRAIVLLRTEHSCHDLRLREDGINKFYRVCCHLHGGDKYLEDLEKPYTWPLENK